MLKYILGLSLIFCIQHPLQADDSASAFNVPSTLSVLSESDKFSLVGKATFSVLFWDIYKSKLLTSSGRYPIENESEQLIFDIKYLVNIDSDELIKRTVEQWQHLGVSDNRYQGFIPELKQLWPDIKKGDQLSLFINERGSYFYFNQTFIGAIESAIFGHMFISIWLSERTSQPTLRKQLIGGKKDW